MAGIAGKINIEFRLIINNAQQQARHDIKTALQTLDEYTRAKNPNTSFTHSSLIEHFGNASPKTITSIKKTLIKIDKVLGDDGRRYNFKYANIGRNLGRAFFCGKYIKLGAPFFQTSLRNQIIGIIHEAGHIIGLNFLVPEFYEGSSHWLPTFYRLFNADDIAIFTFNIARQYEIANKNIA